MSANDRITRALLIPQDDALPIEALQLPAESLGALQKAVGGYIEAVALPAHIDKNRKATMFINEEGKYDDDCKLNARATDMMVPGVGLHLYDYISGNVVIVGINYTTGENVDIPADVEKCVRS